jgi:hypothetical protein
MEIRFIKEILRDTKHVIKLFFLNIFKKNKNFSYLQEFEVEFEKNSQVLFKCCEKILNLLYQIEDKERDSENIEINFLTPVHDLIKKILREKIELQKNLNDLKDFFNKNIIYKEKFDIDGAKNKKNSCPFLEKIKLTIFEINESCYKALKFDEITDILELNKDLVKNLTGLDELNNELDYDEIFNKNDTLISAFKEIVNSVDRLQKKLLKPGLEKF